jgi:hypothetical protein
VALAVTVGVALGLSVSSSATAAGTIFRRELFLDLGLTSSFISVDTIEICLIIDGISCRANQARVENPNWNLSLRSFGRRIATRLAAKHPYGPLSHLCRSRSNPRITGNSDRGEATRQRQSSRVVAARSVMLMRFSFSFGRNTSNAQGFD